MGGKEGSSHASRFVFISCATVTHSELPTHLHDGKAEGMCNELSRRDYCDLCWDAKSITVQFLTGEHYFQFNYPSRMGSLLLGRLKSNGWKLADIFPLIEENAACDPPSRFCYHFQRPAKQEAPNGDQIAAM